MKTRTGLHLRPIILSGSPRSGSSWTSKVLGLARGVRYVREPVLQGKPENWEALHFRYLSEDDDDPVFAAAWDEALSLANLARQRWLMTHTSGWARRLPFVPMQLLVKENFAMLALEWLQRRYQSKVVITIRHPCGFVASSLRLSKENHDTIRPEWLLAQPRLVDQYFSGLRDWIEGIDDQVGQLAAGYGMAHAVIAEQLRRHPEWIVVYHEALCVDPVRVFNRLYTALGKKFTPRIRKELEGSTTHNDGKTYGLNRVSKDEPDKWKRELTSAQIDRVAEVVGRFALPFYREFA